MTGFREIKARVEVKEQRFPIVAHIEELGITASVDVNNIRILSDRLAEQIFDAGVEETFALIVYTGKGAMRSTYNVKRRNQLTLN